MSLPFQEALTEYCVSLGNTFENGSCLDTDVLFGRVHLISCISLVVSSHGHFGKYDRVVYCGQLLLRAAGPAA